MDLPKTNLEREGRFVNMMKKKDYCIRNFVNTVATPVNGPKEVSVAISDMTFYASLKKTRKLYP